MSSEQCEKSTDELINGLNALHDSMHKNQCYACSCEFIDVANEFGTNILAEAIERLKQCVDVVRCKDCKYGIVYKNDVECTAHQEQGYDPEPYHALDWFCADGKRKEGG